MAPLAQTALVLDNGPVKFFFAGEVSKYYRLVYLSLLGDLSRRSTFEPLARKKVGCGLKNLVPPIFRTESGVRCRHGSK
jgi:hypothetical protein